MAVPNTYTPAQYNCNGSTVAFPFTFGVGATSEIEVILTDANGVETILTETTHYTVSAVNNDYESGGTVTTVATYASGNKITIRINVPLTQDADFVEGAPTLYESFENGLDKLTRIAQQLSEGRERALAVPKTESASISREIPDAATRALKLLGFDASGKPVAVVDVEGITLTTFGNALVSSNDADEARAILEAVDADEARAILEAVVLDEDDMASDSAVLPPSQQSVKAYVDAKKLSGDVVQVVGVMEPDAIASSTAIPYDNTKPQKTEGGEIMTLAITPKSASNYLIIDVWMRISCSTANKYLIAALFQDDIADALAASDIYSGNTAFSGIIRLTYYMAAGTTSATTFKVRAGAQDTTAIQVNGYGGATYTYGGVSNTGMTITEVAA